VRSVYPAGWYIVDSNNTPVLGASRHFLTAEAAAAYQRQKAEWSIYRVVYIDGPVYQDRADIAVEG
jgi:hypothetical protein